MDINLHINLNMEEEEEEEEADEIEEEVTNQPKRPRDEPIIHLNLFNNDENENEDEEEEEPLPPVVDQENIEVQSIPKIIESPEFLESNQAVSKNPWDIQSWNIYLDEVQNNNCGSIPIEQAYMKFLSNFPRCSRVWNQLIQYFLANEKYKEAEDTLADCVTKCRDINLWMTYISLKKKKYSLDPKLNSGINLPSFARSNPENKKSMELIYEQAIENVGLAYNSYPIWLSYLQFIRDISESPNSNAPWLRKVYQRAICVSMDECDILWKEYEHMETSHGESFLKELSEYREKYQQAKSFLKDRKKFLSKIQLDRDSLPPSNDLKENQQLSFWNQWIRHEMKNVDLSNPEVHRLFLRWLFEICLNSYYRHPEVWIAFARFEMLSSSSSTSFSFSFSHSHSSLWSTHSALSTSTSTEVSTINPERALQTRRIFREGVEAVPKSALLRIAWAEMEERHENWKSARRILEEAFEAIPCGFTFSALQRLLRRKVGVAAARKIFSDAHEKRKDKGGLQIFLAHALLELDTNCSPEVALRVLNLANSVFPARLLLTDLRFIRLQLRAFLRLGDLTQMRGVLKEAFTEIESAIELMQSSSTSSTSTSPGGTSSFPYLLTSWRGYGRIPGSSSIPSSAANSSSSSPSTSTFSTSSNLNEDDNPFGIPVTCSLSEILMHLYRHRWLLWEDYLQAEMTLGLSDVVRMEQLRGERDRSRRIYEEKVFEKHGKRGSKKNPSSSSTSSSSSSLSASFSGFETASAVAEMNRGVGIYEPCYELSEKFSFYECPLPRVDQHLKERSQGKKYLLELTRKEAERADSLRSSATEHGSGGGSGNNSVNGSLAFLDEMRNIPNFLRELMVQFSSSAIPPGGVPLDTELCLRQIKSLILPPRPANTREEKLNTNANNTQETIDEKKRKIKSSQETFDIYDDEDDNFDDPLSRDDVFRHRQSVRLFGR